MDICLNILAIMHSEFAPDFDVVGIEIQMLGKHGVDVAADIGTSVAEDSGDAFKLFPEFFLDVDQVAFHQLCRCEVCCLELGEIGFALLLADTLLLGLNG